MLERILRLAVERRVAVLVLTLVAAALGGVALARLPIDAVPDITNNQVQINSVAPSLSPEEVERSVTGPVETALAGIPGLLSTRSLSRNGFSQVVAIFEDDVDVWFARQQVAERLREAAETLPDGVDPSLGPVTTGLGEVVMWTVAYAKAPADDRARASGPGLRADGTYVTPGGEVLATAVERGAYLRTVQDWMVRPRVRTVRGVAGVDAIGGHVKQFHVQPDLRLLAAHGLSLEELVDALERNNVATGAGHVEHGGEAYVVRAPGRIERPVEEIGDIPVATPDGIPVRVRDVARVVVGCEPRTGSAGENGEEVVVGTAMMILGGNSRTVARDVVARLEEVRASLPPDVHLKVVLDRSSLVDATVATVARNLGEGAMLVIVVLFALLGNMRAALITAAAIPLSMLLTSAGMLRAGISGNLMSLGAIDFGLIVDGSVIIVENCLRMLAERQHALGRTLTPRERLETVFGASRQVRSATAFGEAIIIMVYVPVLALTGIEGKMFRPMAATVILALGSAFVLSLTFVPAAVAVLVTGRVRERDHPLLRLARRAYEPLLRAALRKRVAVVALAVAAFGGSLLLIPGLGQEFAPTLDEGNLAMHAMRIPGTSLSRSTAMQHEVERTVAGFPEVAFVFSKTGTAEQAADPMPPNVSDTFIMLRPRSEWPDPRESKEGFVRRLRAALAALPGNHYEFTQPIQMRFNELLSGVRADVAVRVYGDDFDAIRRTADAVVRVLGAVPGATDVKAEQVTGLPSITVRVDREAAARHGIDVADVHDVVAAAIGGRAAGVVYEGDRRVDLLVRLPDGVRDDPAAIAALPVPVRHGPWPGETASGADPGFVPLSEVARVETAEGGNQVSRENGRRRIVVQANVRGRDLGGFVAEASERIRRDVRLPAGSFVEWGGQYENLVAARRRLLVVVPACLALILGLLYATLGTARLALLVFTGVPLALSGGIVALHARGIPFSISAAVGFIALSGVAVLNGLVMVTFMRDLREAGRTVDDAVFEGAVTRLRPVLMTALVAALGFVPMAVATGTGAEVQRPLATVVIGGIVSSTLLTLVVLPVLYRMTHREAPSP